MTCSQVPRYLMMLAGPAAHQAAGTPTGAFRTISTTGAFSSVAWIRQDFTARRMPAWSFGFNSGVVTKTCKRPILAGWVAFSAVTLILSPSADRDLVLRYCAA